MIIKKETCIINTIYMSKDEINTLSDTICILTGIKNYGDIKQTLKPYLQTDTYNELFSYNDKTAIEIISSIIHLLEDLKNNSKKYEEERLTITSKEAN